ncbi:nicotinate-mononucleotide adenylyltransferase [Campylobacter mucosalis]|uniref:Probable nicotinate-nucleotide adenylyltransferase n=1 Tax=Campylobacter mucosalis CCUG 21559 TaxID=1032067 RepID=A0A6G5QF38_9BACT|nr:nicotinate (nicotinamide) nucleotide adenylyltransferase [Campylobacter mucosalis]QCD44323.1 nicotinate-mononucleotide adenylyltransferase [Campylobacter mucosalis CCUG 21559]QKF63483.1 nicotinate-mononucleotide adenylyltransferase [Campylobacter mucosalis]
MKIALFGGSFDPPHMGHDSIVKNALEILDIDRLIVMPTFISPFKDEFSAPPQVRFAWVNKIWGKFDRVSISKFEIEQNRPVPTIQTARHLYDTLDIDKLYIIIGADHLSSLDKWHEIDALKKLCTFIIAKRDHIDIPSGFKTMDINEDISSSRIRNELISDRIPNQIKDEVINFYQGEQCKKFQNV